MHRIPKEGHWWSAMHLLSCQMHDRVGDDHDDHDYGVGGGWGGDGGDDVLR